MRVIRDIWPPKGAEVGSQGLGEGSVVTVGSFDGVHRGHVHLLGVLKERARARGGRSVVVTFADHPRRTVEPLLALRELNSLADKQLLIAEQGIDTLVVLPFDDALRRLTPEEFVRDVLVGRLGLAELVVGYNHRLGRDRGGDIKELERLGAKYGFEVHQASRFELPGVAKLSSTAIREALAAGDTDLAERMLGRKI